MIALCFALAAPLGGDDLEAFERPMTLDETESPRVVIGAGAWYETPSGWLFITRGSRPGTATMMRTGRDVDLEPELAPAVEVRVRIWDEHALGARFAAIAATGTTTAEASFLFHGDLFDAGRRVRADVDFNLIDIDYQYEVSVGENVRLVAHAGAEFWTFAGRMRTEDVLPPIDTRRDFSSGFWMAGLDLSWRLSRALEARAFAAGGVERSRQDFFQLEGDVRFHLLDPLSLSLGYHYHELRFLQSTNRSNMTFQGPLLAVELSF